MRPIFPAASCDWWNQSIEVAVVGAAQRAFPNEIGGLILADATRVPTLRLLDGLYTPSSFEADAQAVVSVAYDIYEKRGLILATFHSHPMGQAAFSMRDALQLSDWAHTHVLAVRLDEGWQVLFGQS